MTIFLHSTFVLQISLVSAVFSRWSFQVFIDQNWLKWKCTSFSTEVPFLVPTPRTEDLWQLFPSAVPWLLPHCMPETTHSVCCERQEQCINHSYTSTIQRHQDSQRVVIFGGGECGGKSQKYFFRLKVLTLGIHSRFRGQQTNQQNYIRFDTHIERHGCDGVASVHRALTDHLSVLEDLFVRGKRHRVTVAFKLQF